MGKRIELDLQFRPTKVKPQKVTLPYASPDTPMTYSGYDPIVELARRKALKAAQMRRYRAKKRGGK